MSITPPLSSREHPHAEKDDPVGGYFTTLCTMMIRRNDLDVA